MDSPEASGCIEGMNTPAELSERDRMELHHAAVEAVEAVRSQYLHVDHHTMAMAFFHAMVHRLALGREGIEAIIAAMHVHYRIGQPSITLSDD